MEEVEVRNVRVTEPGGDRSVCQFLELLSTQRMHDRNEHFVFGNRMFEKNSVVTLQGDPRICKDGMQKNVRFVGVNPNNSSAIIQLDAKKSAFFPAMSVIDFVGRFINSNTNTIENDDKLITPEMVAEILEDVGEAEDDESHSEAGSDDFTDSVSSTGAVALQQHIVKADDDVVAMENVQQQSSLSSNSSPCTDGLPSTSASQPSSSATNTALLTSSSAEKVRLQQHQLNKLFSSTARLRSSPPLEPSLSTLKPDLIDLTRFNHCVRLQQRHQKRSVNSKKYSVDLIYFAHTKTDAIHASTKIDHTIRYLSLYDNKYLRYFQ
uniref:Uncharacterized protein n=1 Tax=Globodera rostochiensis TaxID=31243 RepID=A0A914IBT5_GLORO